MIFSPGIRQPLPPHDWQSSITDRPTYLPEPPQSGHGSSGDRTLNAWRSPRLASQSASTSAGSSPCAANSRSTASAAVAPPKPVSDAPSNHADQWFPSGSATRTPRVFDLARQPTGNENTSGSRVRWIEHRRSRAGPSSRGVWRQISTSHGRLDRSGRDRGKLASLSGLRVVFLWRSDGSPRRSTGSFVGRGGFPLGMGVCRGLNDKDDGCSAKLPN